MYDDSDRYSSAMNDAFVAAARAQGTITCPIGGITTAVASRDLTTLGATVAACHSRVIVLLANAYAACTTLHSAQAQGLVSDGFVWVGPDGFVASPMRCGDDTELAVNASVGAIGTAPGRGDSMSLLDDIVETIAHKVSAQIFDLGISDVSAADGVNSWRLGQTAASVLSQISYSDGGGKQLVCYVIAVYRVVVDSCPREITLGS